MKTLKEFLKGRKFESIDGRDRGRLAKYCYKEDALELFGLEPTDEWPDYVEFTKENVLKDLESDLDFAFSKALNQRGISASCMHEVILMWNDVLESGLSEEHSSDSAYAQYGLPLLKETAVLFGFDNPIGDDVGDEEKYSCDYYDPEDDDD